MEHIPVLKEEVREYLGIKKGETVVDATLGLGGHALEMADSIGKKGKLIVFEQDERNLEEARKRLKKYDKKILYIHDNFRYLKTRITELGIKEFDAILFDLGLSSPHVDEAGRGFSFMKDGPLDMRFDPRQKLTAEEIINTYKEPELAKVIYEYGEENLSRMIARKICEKRKQAPFKTTTELAEFMHSIMPFKGKAYKKVHPATKVFQALRIEVNDELNALKEALQQASEMLVVGGRIVVISYHSLEDRIVKHFFKNLENPEITDLHESLYRTHGDPIFESKPKKPVIPKEEEVAINPRSRSGKLRAYRKIRKI
ncbi:MAG: 16S rRNA (cytosine(1402)-N(4))-methyltransferase RsmH [Candidatus Gracilibacteria bacterium]|jgi:16S rRNA (cytosine1402-N4)-methyltransferase